MQRRGRFLRTWALLALFALVPAGVLRALDRMGGQDGADPFALAEVAGRGVAAALDSDLRRWLARCEVLAGEVAGLLGQLPPGPLGNAAEGTLMLHLQQRLTAERDLGELTLLSPEGIALLSTDGTRVGESDHARNPEVAQAARRPAAALVAAGGGSKMGQMVVAAPVWVGRRQGGGGSLRGILVARVRPEAVARLFTSVAPRGMTVDVVDAGGRALSGRPLEGAADIGSESAPGRRWVGGKPVGFVPLRVARSVVVVVGPSPRGKDPALAGWHVVAAAVLFLLAGVASWRISWDPRSR